MNQGGTYRVVVEGLLDQSWTDWFAWQTMNQAKGLTTFTVQVQDQAALYGVLLKVLNLRLPLVGLQRIDCFQSGRKE